MKTLLILFAGVGILGAALVGHIPALADIPILGPTAAWLANIGLGAVPGHIASATSELWTAAVDHHLGPLHLAVLVVAVLLARKVLVWILR